MAQAADTAGSTKDGLEKVESADIVYAILSYNNVDTIGRVVEAVQSVLVSRFSTSRNLIIHADSGSSDGTLERVQDFMGGDLPVVQMTDFLRPADRLVVPYHGMLGKGSAIRTVLSTAQTLGARACAVVDGSRTTVRPEGIEWLVRPVVENGFDFVAPYYLRHKYDGAINRGIVYPMIRALYGKRLRQPVGSDFGFSQAIIRHFLAQKVWESDVERFVIDLWMSTAAVTGNFRICEASLGENLHESREATSDLSEILSQIIGSLFIEMERRVGVWQRMRASERVPIFGSPSAEGTRPIAVNVAKMIDAYRLGYNDLRELWSRILPPSTMLQLKRLANAPENRFRFEDEFWVRTVYDFAIGHRLRVIARDHLLRSLTPLYLGWVASYVQEMENAGSAEVECRLEKLSATFEAEKPYLISRWRWPERSNQ